MGAWGTGSFEKDDACDFLTDVTDAGDLALIAEALDNVLTSTEYVEVGDACQAIVAVETIAAALGRASVAAQEEEGLTSWLSRIRPRVDGALVIGGKQALDRILAAHCGLRECWEDSDDFLQWQASVNELGRQLQV